MVRIVLTFVKPQTKEDLIDKIGWWSIKNGTQDFEESVKKGIISQRSDGKWQLAKNESGSYELNESVRVLLQYPPPPPINQKYHYQTNSRLVIFEWYSRI